MRRRRPRRTPAGAVEPRRFDLVRSMPAAMPAAVWMPPAPAITWVKLPDETHGRGWVCRCYIDHSRRHNNHRRRCNHHAGLLLNHDGLRWCHDTCLQSNNGRHSRNNCLVHLNSLFVRCYGYNADPDPDPAVVTLCLRMQLGHGVPLLAQFTVPSAHPSRSECAATPQAHPHWSIQHSAYSAHRFSVQCG